MVLLLVCLEGRCNDVQTSHFVHADVTAMELASHLRAEKRKGQGPMYVSMYVHICTEYMYRM